MPPRKRLGQLLTELGVVDEHQLQSALGHQKQWGGKLGGILVQKGFCKEEEVVGALSRHLGMPRVKLAEQKVDPRATKFVSRVIAEKLHVFAYEVSGTGRGEVVTIAMSDPTDLSAVDQLAFHTGKRIKPMLAGDSEIVSAIAEHYGPDEKARAAAAAAAPAQAAPAGQTAAAAPAAGPFPRRIEPAGTPAQGSPRGMPSVPKMTPVMTPQWTPAAKAEPPQAQPQREEPAVPAELPPVAPPAPAPAAASVELPEDDGGESMALEPIAAHTQVDEVAGQAEFAGEGSAADSMEGLEPAGRAQEAAQETWTAEAGAGWDSGAGWDAAPSAPASDQGWAAAAPPEPLPDWGDAQPAQPQDWSGGQQGWSAEAPPEEESAAGELASETASAEAPPAEEGIAEAEVTGEELPADAILGTAEDTFQSEAAPDWSAERPVEGEVPAAVEESSPDATVEMAPPESFAGVEEVQRAVAEAEPTAESAEAPDAWASSEDPLAASDAQESAGQAPAASGPQWGELNEAADRPAPEEPWAAAEAPAADPAFAEPAFAEEAPPSGESAEAGDAFAEASHEGFAAEEVPAEEALFGGSQPAPEDYPTPRDGFRTEDFAEPTETPHEEQPPAPDQPFGMSPPEQAPVEGEAAEAEAEPAPPYESEPPPAEFEAHVAREEPAVEPEAEVSEIPVDWSEPPPEETPVAEPGLEGWVAPPPEPPASGAGWLGEALAASAPLSEGDVGTLASAGIDPNDGVGALRLLASLLRALDRRGLIDMAEIAAEVQESRPQEAASAEDPAGA